MEFHEFIQAMFYYAFVPVWPVRERGRYSLPNCANLTEFMISRPMHGVIETRIFIKSFVKRGMEFSFRIHVDHAWGDR